MRSLFTRLFDDAAVFPPGDLPLAAAVPAHVRHHQAAYGDLVGSFVLAARDLDALAPLLAGHSPGSLRLSVTAPLSTLPEAVAAAEAIPAVRLTGLEVTVADGGSPEDVVPSLDAVLAGRDLPVHVEIPRDGRRPALIGSLAGTAYLAKLRTGGVRADLHPGESELAGAVATLARAHVPFKVTAGLHHAIRNTDPETGFEQHGFLNLLVAADAAGTGAEVDDLAAMLGERDPGRVLAAVDRLAPGVRETFRSFGTCSITEPVDELRTLGLLAPSTSTDHAGKNAGAVAGDRR